MLAQRNIPFTRIFNYDYTSLDNKSVIDIIEVIYTWQQLKEDAENKFLIKRFSLNQITLDQETKNFSVEIKSTDFSKVIDNETYFEILSIKYSGDSFFRDIILKNPDRDTYSTIEIKPSWTQITS